jgi:hypothetical protein
MHAWRRLLRFARNDASIGRRPPLDWRERLAEETPDIVMAAFGHHAFLLA